MKWKQASVASAVALVVAGALIAQPAMASVATQTTNPQTNANSTLELTLVVWDIMAGYAYVRDLGTPSRWTYAQGKAAQTAQDSSLLFNQSLSFEGGDANYATFLADLAGVGHVNSNSTYWGVYSSAKYGPTTELVTTFDANLTPVLDDVTLSLQSSTSSKWTSLAAGMTSSKISTEKAGIIDNDGSAVTTASEAAGPIKLGWGQGWGYAGNNRTFNKIGTSLTSNFYEVQSTTQADGILKLAGTWTLNATTGALSYDVAPVPEPSSWLLAAIGMGLAGFMSWRRRI